MEKLRRPGGEGAEEQGAPAVEVADIEVRAAEGAGVGRGRAVGLGEVAVDDGGVVADEPLAGDGEGAEAAGDGEARGLEERERAAAGADKHEGRAHGAGFAGVEVAHGEFPVGVGAAEAVDAVAGEDAAVFLRAEPREEVAGEEAEVHIGAGVDLGGGDGFAVGAAVDEERGPAAKDGGVGGKLHRSENRMPRERGVAGAEEGDGVGAADKAEVRHGADPVGGPGGEAVRDGVAPELAGEFEAGEDFEGFGDVDGRAGRRGRGRVVEFAEAGVAGAGVVPAGGAFGGEVRGGLVDLDGETRVEAFEHRADVGGHDAAADEDDVGGGGRGHGGGKHAVAGP